MRWNYFLKKHSSPSFLSGFILLFVDKKREFLFSGDTSVYSQKTEIVEYIYIF